MSIHVFGGEVPCPKPTSNKIFLVLGKIQSSAGSLLLSVTLEDGISHILGQWTAPVLFKSCPVPAEPTQIRTVYGRP